MTRSARKRHSDKSRSKVQRFPHAFLAAALVSGPAYSGDSSLTEGEIRAIDKKTNAVIIRHAAIRALRMPAMTMAFQVKDPRLLDQVKAGDKVRFHAERSGGDFTVSRIER